MPHSRAHAHVGGSADGNAGQHQPEPLHFCFPAANTPVSMARKEKQDFSSAPGLDKAALGYWRVWGLCAGSCNHRREGRAAEPFPHHRVAELMSWNREGALSTSLLSWSVSCIPGPCPVREQHRGPYAALTHAAPQD